MSAPTYRVTNWVPVLVSMNGAPPTYTHVLDLTGTKYTLEDGGDFTFEGPEFKARVSSESVPFLKVETKRVCSVMDLWVDQVQALMGT